MPKTEQPFPPRTTPDTNGASYSSALAVREAVRAMPDYARITIRYLMTDAEWDFWLRHEWLDLLPDGRYVSCSCPYIPSGVECRRIGMIPIK
jgi:hypothetical protein